ncbi:adenylyl-sulfate kinase [Salinicola avicenniae]|uniref:adenylyl-sulfate kinase n=1 Tax=Salinicola avicenniae TaxID=2916836 RepID=UPI00207450C1|nr:MULTISPECIES: adenylyl-sulfate kinase [unclassified Salinicola]
MSELPQPCDDIRDLSLRAQEARGMLRVITCGSAGSGKSTLIERLAYEANGRLESRLGAMSANVAPPFAGASPHSAQRTGDQEAISPRSAERREARLGEGRLEDTAGIDDSATDLSHRFFATDRRQFIVADAPGEERHTRNTATGASTASLALVLIDARQGMQAQTRRHSVLCGLLGIRHVVVVVSQMERVAYSRARYEEIVAAYREFADQLITSDIHFLPVSARAGDNIAGTCQATMPWFEGPSLLDLLETVEGPSDIALSSLRFPVQYVNSPNLHFRGYCGTLAGGSLAVGQGVRVEPSGQRSRIARIVTDNGDLEKAEAGQSITLTLADDIAVGRGDVLVPGQCDVTSCTAFTADVIWLHEQAMAVGQEYELKAGGRHVVGRVTRIIYEIDIDTMTRQAADRLLPNGIGRCQVEVAEPLLLDSYSLSPQTGNFILIDRQTHLTLGGGMVVDTLSAGNIVWHEMAVNKRRRAERHRQKPSIVWFTGLSGSGKSSVANALERQLFGMGYSTYLLDGDNLRHGLCRDLGFGAADRRENIRRVGEVARLMVDAGLITLVSFISPFRDDRRLVRGMVEPDEFIEVYVNTPLAICEQRDPKGLYRRARAGDIKEFTGISSPYEAPLQAEAEIDTSVYDLEENVSQLIAALRRYRVI